MQRKLDQQRYFRLSGLPLAVVPIGLQEAIGVHAHEFSELVVIRAGAGVHFTDEEEYPVTAGDVFVIHGSTSHGYRQTQGLRLDNILFDLQKLRLPAADLRRLAGYHALCELEPRLRRKKGYRGTLRLGMEDLATAGRMIRELTGELSAKTRGYRFVATAIFMQLLVFLCRRYEETQAQPPGQVLRIGEVLGWLERHYAEAIRLEDLAGLARMSESSLLRAFRAAVGVSPIDYLLRLRIRKAAELLTGEALSVTDAAFRVGFADSNYFTRQFRKVLGCTPREFRRLGRAMG